jgi:6-phosphogluconolactonase
MIIKDVRESLAERAARIIADTIQDILEERDRVVLAIPGGSSVAGIFECLREQNIDGEKAHVFMVDERMVPIDHEDSNFRLVREHLAGGTIPEENLHPFHHDRPDEYARELEFLGGRFDIVLVSSGEDGHVAGLFPYHHSLKEEGVFITMDDSPKPPPGRMSSSKELLEKSGVGIVLFFGDAKRDALKAFVQDGPAEPCPARIIRSLPQWYALTDQEAE